MKSLSFTGWFDPKQRYHAEMSRISRVIVCSLFRHCYNTTEDLLFLKLVEHTVALCPEDTPCFPEFLSELFNSYIR